LISQPRWREHVFGYMNFTHERLTPDQTSQWMIGKSFDTPQ
jgi:hypothetical protein